MIEFRNENSVWERNATNQENLCELIVDFIPSKIFLMINQHNSLDLLWVYFLPQINQINVQMRL